MCGIVGYMNVGQTSNLLRNKLSLSLRHLSHRGPDDVGVWYCSFGDCEIGIGHTRLSIIDLNTRRNKLHDDLDAARQRLLSFERYLAEGR